MSTNLLDVTITVEVETEVVSQDIPNDFTDDDYDYAVYETDGKIFVRMMHQAFVEGGPTEYRKLNCEIFIFLGVVLILGSCGF